MVWGPGTNILNPSVRLCFVRVVDSGKCSLWLVSSGIFIFGFLLQLQVLHLVRKVRMTCMYMKLLNGWELAFHYSVREEMVMYSMSKISRLLLRRWEFTHF